MIPRLPPSTHECRVPVPVSLEAERGYYWHSPPNGPRGSVKKVRVVEWQADRAKVLFEDGTQTWVRKSELAPAGRATGQFSADGVALAATDAKSKAVAKEFLGVTRKAYQILIAPNTTLAGIYDPQFMAAEKAYTEAYMAVARAVRALEVLA